MLFLLSVILVCFFGVLAQILAVRLRLLGVLVFGELLMFLLSLLGFFWGGGGMTMLIVVSVSACLVAVGICACVMFFRGVSSSQMLV